MGSVPCDVVVRVWITDNTKDDMLYLGYMHVKYNKR